MSLPMWIQEDRRGPPYKSNQSIRTAFENACGHANLADVTLQVLRHDRQAGLRRGVQAAVRQGAHSSVGQSS